jgi:hypothetical protein
LGLRETKQQESEEKYKTKSFVICSPPNIIRAFISIRIRWAGYVERMKTRRGADRALVERPDGKRPLGRPRHSWEKNNKIDFKDIG